MKECHDYISIRVSEEERYRVREEIKKNYEGIIKWFGGESKRGKNES